MVIAGNYRSWIVGAKGIETAVDLYQIIIVCPDGNNSWYWDSPVDPLINMKHMFQPNW
jgi:hypothetical protein